LDSDTISNTAVKMLQEAGIKFQEHAKRGINSDTFAEYLVASGMLLNDKVKWVCFHGAFDFGYLIRMIHGEKLPDNEEGFNRLLNTLFPAFYDVKYMIKDVDTLKTVGLSKLGTELSVKRVGTAH